MRFGSVCSGIEAASMAWHPLGWTTSFVSEIDPFPRAVLQHHYPNTPLHGDFTTIEAKQYDAIDLLVGGTPCQSFSIAGLRGGLGDDCGNLSLEYLRLADRLRPRWLVWENVPGVLSSNAGRDFGAILGGMVELGYGFAYRVLDAQYVRTLPFPWAVPQRRRRVFVVGYLGDWRRAAAVLFDQESLYRNPPPRRDAGQKAAPTLAARTKGGGGLGTDFDCDGGLVFGGNRTSGPIDVAPALNAAASGSRRIDFGSEAFVAHSLRGEGFDASEDGTGRGTPLMPVAIQERAVSENPDIDPDGAGTRVDDATYTLEARTTAQAVAYRTTGNDGAYETGAKVDALTTSTDPNSHVVAFAENSRAELRLQGGDGQVSSQLTTGGGKPGQGHPCIALNWAVRRLTPRECERLQGFPDDYTNIPWRGKNGAPDGRRYKALGNSMAVNCMRWIGDRIQLVEGLSA